MAQFRTALPALIMAARLLFAGSAWAADPGGVKADGPPDDSEVAAVLETSAARYRIPVALLDGLAWRESRWHQWDAQGNVTEAGKNHIGLLGVWVGGRRNDAERLRTDWRYNIDQGARQLQECWFRAPIIGDGHLEDSRDILESWYFALARYGDGRQNDDANRFADSVLDAVATGGEGRWAGVAVNRLSAADAAACGNVFCPPVPWHFAGLSPLPPAASLVSLPVPYLSQVYDSPDDFSGGGSCGPTSMLMVLAYYHKIQPQPILVQDSYKHTSDFGGLIPAVTSAVCMPQMGAVHAKMLNYMRPAFPGVSIFYNEKATPERVKAELDAGRPCILGTEVTSAGHIMVVRGYLSDGRFLVNDPAGDFYQVGRKRGPDSPYAGGARRYCNGDGSKAIYDWDALAVRWVMTFGPSASKSDRAEDE